MRRKFRQIRETRRRVKRVIPLVCRRALRKGGEGRETSADWEVLLNVLAFHPASQPQTSTSEACCSCDDPCNQPNLTAVSLESRTTSKAQTRRHF